MQVDGVRQYEFVKEFDYIREAGTEEECRAADQITEIIRGIQGACEDTLRSASWGETVRTEQFTFEDFEISESRLRVLHPYEKEYTVRGYMNCGSTGEEGIKAPLLYVENGDEISLSGARGAVVLLNMPVRRELYRQLTAAGAAGFLTVCGTPIDQGEDRIPKQYRLSFSGEKPIQGAAVHYCDAVELIEKKAEQCVLTVKQRKVERCSRNVAVRISGSDKSDEILTVTAHYDSVPEGPGAYDNMSGAAIVMETYRYFTEHHPRRTVEFVWFGAEEKGLKGSRAYVKAHEAEIDSHIFNMNVDLAGQLIGGNVIGITGGADICEAVGALMREKKIGMTIKNQVWASDSNTFAWKGVPALTLNRDGFGMHTRYDTAELISPLSLRRSAELLCTLADWMANTEILPFKREIPGEMREQLESDFSA